MRYNSYLYNKLMFDTISQNILDCMSIKGIAVGMEQKDDGRYDIEYTTYPKYSVSKITVSEDCVIQASKKYSRI